MQLLCDLYSVDFKNYYCLLQLLETDDEIIGCTVQELGQLIPTANMQEQREHHGILQVITQTVVMLDTHVSIFPKYSSCVRNQVYAKEYCLSNNQTSPSATVAAIHTQYTVGRQSNENVRPNGRGRPVRSPCVADVSLISGNNAFTLHKRQEAWKLQRSSRHQ